MRVLSLNCRLVRSAALALLAVVPTASARAQVVIHTWHADVPGDGFGSDVALVGDMNADGTDDHAVGIRFSDVGAPLAGAVRAVSGVDGAVLWTHYATVAGANLGRAVDGAGDVDGDGVPDVVAGATGSSLTSLGQAFVLSGVDGHVIRELQGWELNSSFGYSVAGVGDVDADGLDDVLVGAPTANVSLGGDTGGARVYSGATGQPIHVLRGVSAADHFGESVSGAGDVDGDGRPDFLVGAYLQSGTGAAQLFSGLDGSLLRTYSGEVAGAGLGRSVANAGDVDADGVPDQIVRADRDATVTNGGVAYVYSGSDGSTLFKFYGNPAFAGYKLEDVGGAGDVDGDGRDDLVLGMPQLASSFYESRVELRSGLDGGILMTIHAFDPPVGDTRFGSRVAPAGDVDQDGHADVLIASSILVSGAFDGIVHLVTADGSFAQVHCTAKPTSLAGCIPDVTFSGTPSKSLGSGFLIQASHIPGGGNLGLLFYGTSGHTALPFLGGTLCVKSPVTRLSATQAGGSPGQCDGSLLVDFNTVMAGLPGIQYVEVVDAQFWFRDPPEPISGSGLSNAIRFAPCP
jgi:hypothetical protein